MGRATLLALAFVLLLLPFATSAYSLPEVNSLLASYNVPGAVISSLQPIPMSYAGNQYLGMYNDSYPYFIVNLTGAYSLVINTTAIYNIIRNYTINVSLSQANFTQLHDQMALYMQSSSGPVNDCLVETGLSTGATCTLDNYCSSCQFIPNCKSVLDATHGPSGIFGTGIMQFASQYASLNASYTTFIQSTSNVTKSNVLVGLDNANKAFANISNLTQTMYQNPLFPPTANVTPNVIAGCASYINQSIAPWYCNSLGYCQSLSYNYTKLAYISILLDNLNLLPLSNSQIFSLAFNVSANESVYAYPILSKERLAMLNATLNKTVPDYDNLVNGSISLLGHVKNATLKSQLTALVNNYNNITVNYFYANFSQANITLATQYAALETTYHAVNSTYSDIVSRASNNTAKILELQLYSGSAISSQISDLALAQLSINAQIAAGGLTNLLLLDQQLSALSAKVSQYSTSPITLNEIARAIDSPFIRGLASSLGLTYAGGVGMAPLLGSLLSLIIGIFVLAALFFSRSYLKLHHRIVLNKRTEQNWHRIFLTIGILIFLYVIVTYFLLAGASASAPFSSFQSAYSSSSYVVTAINGTPTLGTLTCASKIGAVAATQNKTSVVAQFTNGECKVGNSTSTVDDCLNFYAKANIPVIVLTNSTHSSLSLYSLYGTVLHVSGNDTVMNDCYVSLVLNR